MAGNGFFWLHIKKAGGQSFRRTFSPPYVLTDRKSPKPFSEIPREEWNDALNNYRLPLGEYDYRRALFAKRYLYLGDDWENRFKFVIVRNPYDRAVSCWNYLARPVHRGRWFRRFEQRRFEAFLSRLPHHWEEKQKRWLATHTAPIWPDIADEAGRLLMDEVFKLEELDQRLPELCARIGVEREAYAHYRGGGERKRHYRYYYTPSSKKLVEELYGDDIEKLNYDF